ncbi:aminotransferase class IV [Cohnella lubricantis]|uniref:Aminotransferase class IV n=1 Tax=Cohnella lubricantis TaxID=2163172 RepID=A0A841TKF6_9BACL|nr:aminotransferase class IV [Cohnella lubricantis]MBB6679688.1 aminotransferase class IV [Cohnella lubricantis]MBP2119390.1 4-amino-4-deoxychorismate lyase [Cohnella lubricantis]
MKPALLIDGQLTNSEEAVISVYDHGFLYGIGLFETLRTYGGKPWLLERHARRLAEGCRALGIAYAPDISRMAESIAMLLAASGLPDAYIRWSVSAGAGAVGLPAGDYERPREIVYAKPLAPDAPQTRASKTLRLLRLRRSSPEGDVRLKSFHYMNNILAKRELIAGGAAPGTEGLFLNAAGHVVEGLVSNVFWAKDGTLYTPSLEAGPLPGITAAFVRELAARRGVPAIEGLYEPEVLAEADEIFTTNSIQEMVPAAALEDSNGNMLSSWTEPGEMTRSLMTDYRAAAERGSDDETYLS